MEPVIKGMGLRKFRDPNDDKFRMRSVMRPTVYPPHRYYNIGELLPLDQGETGTCVNHAWSGFLAAAPLTTETFENPLVAYRGTVLMDEFEDNDYEATAVDDELQSGTTIRAGAKYYRSKGYIKSFVWARTADEIAAWILIGNGTVVVGTNWYFGMSDLDSKDTAHLTGESLGGHAWLLIGYSRVMRKFRALNSWGKEFGAGGRFWIGHDDVDRLIRIERGEACAAMEQLVVI